jgi:predicted RNase H-like HicB family nuclease
MRKYYPALLHHHAADADYGVTFPNFPGCVSCGDTQQEAIEMAHEALQLHVKGMTEDGETLPEPYPVDGIPEDPELQTDIVAVALIGAVIPRPPKRVNISMDEALLEEIDRGAYAYGMSRSSFLAEASRRLLAGQDVR